MFLTRDDRRYYVYANYTEDSEYPFYIGKGSGHRAWTSSKRSEEWCERAKDGFYTKLIQFNMMEPCAYTLEKIMIAIARKSLPDGSLVNVLDGGSGVPGLSHTDASREARRQKMSGPNNRLYGKKMPQHIIDAARKANTGRKRPDELKSRQSKLMSGKNHPQLDLRIHKFWHPDGREFEGLQFDFLSISGITRPQITNLIKGKIKTSGGWRYDGVTDNA